MKTAKLRQLDSMKGVEDEEIKYWVMRLLWQGYVPNEIARYLGIPVVNIWYFFKRMGIVYRKEFRWSFKMVPFYLCPKCRTWLIDDAYCITCKGYWICDDDYKSNKSNYKMVSTDYKEIIKNEWAKKNCGML